MTALHISYGTARHVPVEELLSVLPSLPRAVLNRLVDRAIEHMDRIDGEADLEPAGDELDTGNTEDEPFAGRRWYADRDGPGCSVSDP